LGAEAAAEVLARGVIGIPPPGHDLPRTGRMSLGPTPVGWSLDRVARSHGWSGLPPTAYDERRQRLHRTLALPDAGPLTVTVNARGTVSWGRAAATRADRAAIRTQLRLMLCVEDDVSELYAACAGVPWLAWVPAAGGGRLLRSPTVWEDLARMLATTNCSWALTRAMLTKLVDSLGEVGPAGERAFPTRAAVTAAGVGHLREVVRAGYRAESFVALAGTELDVESWLGSELDDQELTAAIVSLRGFGPYAAEGLLGLLGRPRGLAIDSWVRAKLPRVVGRELTDADIRARYAPLGRWAGWGLWLELTRDWYDPAPTTS
jgi:3-methyladenine DNA glycosylase/8-oxoguanine DNA glycosylase